MNFSGHYSNTDHIFILSNILFKLLSHTVKQCKRFLSLGNLRTFDTSISNVHNWIQFQDLGARFPRSANL